MSLMMCTNVILVNLKQPLLSSQRIVGLRYHHDCNCRTPIHQIISVVHWDRPNRAYLTLGSGLKRCVMIQDHRYLDPPIIPCLVSSFPPPFKIVKDPCFFFPPCTDCSLRVMSGLSVVLRKNTFKSPTRDFRRETTSV
jgi:hypothetical protein